MNQQTRRQFFKTVAATVAAGTAAVVAPSVLTTKRPGVDKIPTYKGVPFYYMCGSHDSYIVGHYSEHAFVGRRSGYIVTSYENPNPKTR